MWCDWHPQLEEPLDGGCPRHPWIQEARCVACHVNTPDGDCPEGGDHDWFADECLKCELKYDLTNQWDDWYEGEDSEWGSNTD